MTTSRKAANTMTKPSKAKDSMKATILTAAQKVFGDLGYEGASFRNITDICGAKRALILYHFKTKENLWKETVVKVKDEYLGHFNRIYTETNPQTDDEKGRRLTIAFLKAAREVPEYGRILLHEGIVANDRIAWMTQQMTPDQITIPVYEDPDYTQVSFRGLARQIQSGALLYLGNMGPLMAMDAPADSEYPVDPLTDETIDKIADYMLALIKMRVEELKRERLLPQ